ncbi:hypothetical protein ACQJBY_027600 [Aegilops geniculata]
MAPAATPCSPRLLLASSASPPPLFRVAARPLLPGSRRGGVRLRVRCGAADEEAEARRGEQVKASVEEMAPGLDLVTLAACLVGLLTGVSVVLFNLSVGACEPNYGSILSEFEIGPRDSQLLRELFFNTVQSQTQTHTHSPDEHSTP